MEQEVQKQAGNKTGFTSKNSSKSSRKQRDKAMKMTKKQRFLHAIPAIEFEYLVENKYIIGCAMMKNAPTPTPPPLRNCDAAS
jgi:hypothetical protein